MEILNYVPVWLRVNHLLNFFFITLLIRSGIQILADHPKLYFNDHSTPGTEWLKFGKKKLPEDRLWTSLEESVTPMRGALPGGFRNLGLGRMWHFLAGILWLLNGLVYIVLLFVTGMWRTLIPTSFSIFPEAWQTLLTYLHFQIPASTMFNPFDPLQQLTYASIVFIVVPLMLLSGLAMSPAIIGRFPWYAKMFGGRQAARSIHFLGMISIIGFTIIHVTLVFVVNYPHTVNSIVFGDPAGNSGTLATVIIIFTVLAVILLNLLITIQTLKHKRGFQLVADRILNPILKSTIGRLVSKQEYTKADISPFYRVNGFPPTCEEYKTHTEHNFTDWKLRIYGLVEHPLSFSLQEIQAMPKEEFISKHNCIQGWSAIAEWGGVSLSHILDLVKPKTGAKYIVFVGYDMDDKNHHYREVLTLKEARMPQTILAYEMNGIPLPIPHGAPLRLRAESRLGFKMVKYIKEIHIVEFKNDVLERLGGTHEKLGYYDSTGTI